MSESWPAGIRGFVGQLFLLGGAEGQGLTSYIVVGGWLVDYDYHSNNGDCADTTLGVN